MYRAPDQGVPGRLGRRRCRVAPLLTLRGAVAVEGGLPLTVDGKIIGAIGVSGGTPEQDGVVAKAGVDAMAAK